MKHFAKSQEITAISWPFGEQNHAQWNISGFHIIKLETVIVYTAFSEGHRESDRGTNKERGEAGGEQAKVDFSPQSRLQHVPSPQITGNCNFAAIAVT